MVILDVVVDAMRWMVAYAPQLFCIEEVFVRHSSLYSMNIEDLNVECPVLKPLWTLHSWSSTDGEMPVATLCESLKGH